MGRFHDRMAEELDLRGFSANTRKAYLRGMFDFVKFEMRAPDLLGIEDVRNYQLHLIRERGLAPATVNQRLAAIRFFYTHVLELPAVTHGIPRQKDQYKLPVVLSEEEVAALLVAPPNLKHRAILVTTYSVGLRSSEVCELQVADLDSERKTIHIRQAKGNKDRYVPFSGRLVTLLREYYRAYQPETWLFPNDRTGQTLHETTIQRIFNAACLRAGITKHVSVHSLRHATATHLAEKGVPVQVIQELLGHSSLETTMRYVHLAKDRVNQVRSPLDELLLPKGLLVGATSSRP